MGEIAPRSFLDFGRAGHAPAAVRGTAQREGGHAALGSVCLQIRCARCVEVIDRSSVRGLVVTTTFEALRFHRIETLCGQRPPFFAALFVFFAERAAGAAKR